MLLTTGHLILCFPLDKLDKCNFCIPTKQGAGQSKLGIYIKSVVPGGAAAADGRLAAGDQLLSVDGHSLVGITQEKVNYSYYIIAYFLVFRMLFLSSFMYI